jgi:hypothetical protein
MRASEGKGKEMHIALHCACSVDWRVLVEEELLQSARLIYCLWLFPCVRLVRSSVSENELILPGRYEQKVHNII